MSDLIVIDNGTFVDRVYLDLVKASGVVSIDCVHSITSTKSLLHLYTSSFLCKLEVSSLKESLYSYCDTLLALLKISIFVVLGKKRKILDTKLRNQKIGDALVSGFLRSRNSSGIYLLDFRSYFLLLKQVLLLHCAYEFAKQLQSDRGKISKNIVFLITETTYFPEACRRLFVSLGVVEVRWNPALKTFSKFSGFNGIHISKFEHIKESLLTVLLDRDCSIKGQILLDKLVRREWTYPYMKKSDVNPQERIVYSFSPEKSYAVIFMHAVSDAQYIFGDHDFLDLHDWLIKSINICIELGIVCVLKLHPSFFSEDHNYESDARYLQYIQGLLSFDISDFSSQNPSQILRTSDENILIAAPQLSSNQLAAALGSFIGITHHGSIAFELAFQGLPCICSSLSHYSFLKALPPQIKTYSNIEDYRSAIEEALAEIGNESLSFDRSCWRDLFSLFFFLSMNYYRYPPIAVLWDVWSNEMHEKTSASEAHIAGSLVHQNLAMQVPAAFVYFCWQALQRLD